MKANDILKRAELYIESLHWPGADWLEVSPDEIVEMLVEFAKEELRIAHESHDHDQTNP